MNGGLCSCRPLSHGYRQVLPHSVKQLDTGSRFVVGISCWYLLRNRQKEFALSSIKVAAAVGLFASLVTAWTGDISGVQVAKVQPMKMAAAEGLHDGGNGVPFTIAGDLKIPKMLSILATHDIDGYVPGINNLLEGGYQMPDGTTALSAEEKLNADRLPSPPWMHSAKRIRQVTKQVPQQLARHWTKT